jgi:hypothetical protein
MKCKICGKELVNIINELFMCPTEDNKLHTYTVYGLPMQTEEFRILDEKTDRGYVVWIQHEVKETQLRVILGSKMLSQKTLENIVLDIGELDEKSLLDRIEKLMVLV